MAIKKEVFVMSVVFDTRDTYGGSALASIEHEMYNLDGFIEWDSKIKKVETLEVTEEDLEGGE